MIPDLVESLRHGTGDAWVLFPAAIVLGALHGLEPGHSKTMMAAFIIAVRGTVAQAVMLGVAATISHTGVVWLVALIGASVGEKWNAEEAEPWFQSASGVVILGMAAWMFFRMRRHGHACGHDHGHDHGGKCVDTGHGEAVLEIHEDGVPPRFRIRERGGRGAEAMSVVTTRPGGTTESFAFVRRDGFWESVATVPEPHEFVARLKVTHHGHAHDFDIEFTEHGHAHVDRATAELDNIAATAADAHELAHANDIRKRFSGRTVTTGQILLFGLTGGLIPCPAAITVLMVCLQLKRVALGSALVLGFSVGLAMTLVASGVLAAASVRFAGERFSGFGKFSALAPWISTGLIGAVGLYMLAHGVIGLSHGHP